MATDVDQAYYNGWPQDELSDVDEPKEAVTSQMPDHGSISFGRFSIESLSWERKSVFIHNRHQEELEKFNGLVAKKKAYFEEHYRKIRASRASEQNQQTELTLDYGVDGSNSSQTEEENESASQHESPREAAANIVESRSEEVQVGAIFDQEISCNGVVQQESSEIKSTSATVPQELSLSEESIGIIEHDGSSNGDMPVDLIDTELLSLTEKVGEIEKVHKGSVDNKEPKLEKLKPKFESKSLNKAHVKDIKNSESDNLCLIKKPSCSRSAPNIKGSSVTRNVRMLDRKPKQNASQPLKGIKRPSQKISDKAENNQIGSNKQTAQQVQNNDFRSALAPPNRSFAEPHSKIITPGPFTLVMERRASSRNAAKLDTMNSVKLPSSSIRTNNSSNMQTIPKKNGTVSEVTGQGAEGKRLTSEVNIAMRKPLAMNRKQANMRRNEKPMQRTIKPRLSSSINLPARNANVRAEFQLSTPKLPKQEILQGKETNQMKQSQATAAKFLGSSMNRNSNFVTKKQTQPRVNEKIHSGNKQRIDNLSLDDGRKTRQETQRWR